MSYQQYPQQPQAAYAQQPQHQSPPVGYQQQPYQAQQQSPQPIFQQQQSPQPSFQQQQQQQQPQQQPQPQQQQRQQPQQPQSPQPVTGVYQQQQAMAATHAAQVHTLPAQTQEWSNGLCDCGPCSTCMLACCCPCILIGKTSARMRDPSMQSYDTFNGECMIACCLGGFAWIYGMIKREEIRQRFGIRGSGTDDCCVSYWCSCCALIQQEKEVKGRLGGNAGVVQVVTQGYQAPSGKEGMHMPGQ
ncbi:PLAC8 family-domain-containing protein [Cladorrhinum sp. PSN259]|nr:PLAC8 family-domain-containing protein [Cladorrhinum sp. PSN259]